jgi:hypothetical protein
LRWKNILETGWPRHDKEVHFKLSNIFCTYKKTKRYDDVQQTIKLERSEIASDGATFL